MNEKLVFVSGTIVDAGKFDDEGVAIYRVEGGLHDGHEITVMSEKHNCGAYGESVKCSCDASWQSAMYGCWQANHQREEGGDELLKEMMRTYEYVGEPI